MGAAAGSATKGSAAAKSAPLGPGVKSAPLGPGAKSAPIGTTANGAAKGAASVGIGAAKVGAASVADPSLVTAPGDRLADPRSGAPGVHPMGEERAAAPVVGAKAAAAKAAGGLDAESAGLRGAGNELRAKMRTQRRLRVVTLVSLAAVVLVVLPVLFGLRSASNDPVFGSLDSLGVPSWASQDAHDNGSGSRWCFIDCRFRERIAQSSKSFKETSATYSAALTKAGWEPWKVSECPDTPIAADQGTYSCWKRDEFTLDLWVRLPECAVDQVAAQDPTAQLPSAAATREPKNCAGSTVSIKVQNAISDTRGKPERQDKPLVGETPDPVLSNDPLLEPTPAAS